MWWTAPIYLVFLFGGLYLEGFSVTPALGLLLGVLAAFGLLDAVVLGHIASIRARRMETVAELEGTRRQIDRLSRMLLLGGGAFGAAFLIGVIALALL